MGNLVALITGASKGTGKEIARQLVDAGCTCGCTRSSPGPGSLSCPGSRLHLDLAEVNEVGNGVVVLTYKPKR